MLRICHMTSVHNRYDGRIFQKECSSLAKEKYEVVLLVNDDQEDEEKNGVRIRSVKISSNRIIRILTAANKMFRKALEVNADIYHIHDPELLPLAEKLSGRGKHVVYDSHEFYYYQIRQKYYIPELLRNPIAEIYRRYEVRVLKRIDAVITPCTICGKNYFDNIAKKTVFVDNLPEKDRYSAKPFSEKDSPLNYCYVGSLTEQRGIIEMLKASIESDGKFVLAGDFEESIKAEAEQYLLQEVIDYRGYANKEDVQKIYDEAGIGLSVLHNSGQYKILDNMPTKVYEYMLAGIPIILSRREYSEKFIKKYPVGILVEPENVNEIVDSIRYLQENVELASEMGKLGRQVILNELCWEKEIKKIIDLYENIVS